MTAPEKIMVSACGKAIVTGQKAFPDDVEYIRADLFDAALDRAKREEFERGFTVGWDERLKQEANNIAWSEAQKREARVEGMRMALAEIQFAADQERACDALRDLIEAERGKP